MYKLLLHVNYHGNIFQLLYLLLHHPYVIVSLLNQDSLHLHLLVQILMRLHRRRI